MSSLSNGTPDIYEDELLYKSIEELPVWNWYKITQDNDLKYLFKNIKHAKKLKYLGDIWDNIQQEYLDEFGIDTMFLARLKAMRKVIGLRIRMIDSGDKSLLNLIKVEEQRIIENKSISGMKFYALLDVVSTAKGFRIDPKQISVIEWFYALKNMENNHGKGNSGQGHN